MSKQPLGRYKEKIAKELNKKEKDQKEMNSRDYGKAIE